MGDTMITTRRNVAHLLAGVVGLGMLTVVAPHAGAQQPTAANARWQAWIGCWQVDDPTQPYNSANGIPVVCVVPGANASAVDVLTVDSGKVVSRYVVDASGAQHSVNRDGCTGFERASWSSDSLRVFLNSDLTCGALKRTSTGVMSMSPSGEWVMVDAVRAGGNEAVRSLRYREIGPPAQLPAEISVPATLARRMDRQTAAIAAGAKLTAGSIVEAVAKTDTAAVQAWLVERHEKYNLSANLLVAMADAGVPGSVTDVMVAASFPDEFHFARGAALPMTGELSPRDSARIASDYLFARNCDPMSYYSPYGWGVNPCGSAYSSYRYGYPGYYGYGYNGYNSSYGYGYPGYYSGYYGGPVVIVPNGGNSDAGVSGHGRAVRGQGYTRSGGESTGSSSSGSTSSGASSSGGSSASPSTAGSSSAGAGSSSSSGRTAIPRPPT